MAEGNTAGDVKTNDYERIGQVAAKNIIDRESNLGATNPRKGASARTLFYQGAKNSGSPDVGKFNQFLFYGVGSDVSSKEFIESYYRSENRSFNNNISSLASKNPTANNLIKNNDSVVGGKSCPYNWSDFLYCKFYGRIPNNYMVTLRRFQTPMLDNLSLPNALKDNDLFDKEGVGKPIAQAVTWFGGGSGNTLDNIIGFSAGIKYTTREQSGELNQKGFDQGLFKSPVGTVLETQASNLGLNQAYDAIKAILQAGNLITDEGQENITNAKVAYGVREAAAQGNGPLSDFIFTSVDVIDSTYIRERGLDFTSNELSIKFSYEITSVSEVNSKAAFMDIFANIMSIGTNYGNFLTPDYRYDNSFPAVGFPGGNDGLLEFYKSPISFMTKLGASGYLDKMPPDTQNQATIAAETAQSITTGDTNKVTGGKEGYPGLLKFDTEASKNPDVLESVDRISRGLLSGKFLETFQMNQSFLTGAPIGEWHLVVGNPMNPIAMIGNLICTKVDIRFGEKLGPDDFPTELEATFSLAHGRPREKGEIESMFNRGEGRLYQSTIKPYSNVSNPGTRSTIDGTITDSSNTELQDKVTVNPQNQNN